MVSRKIMLNEEDIPKQWYNIAPDLPKPLPPPISPETKEPVNPSALEPIFAKELIKQEISQERWIKIPEEVREVYRIWRPTPLYRATGLEKALKTPAKIYYKYEGVSPPGSHKPNTAVAQAYYNMKQGIERITTETGAGQWGSALAYGCSMFGLECAVYMVKVSYQQKPYRKVMMENWGAQVHASPSNNTEFGRRVLEDDPKNSGSLGLAISEAMEDAVSHDNTRYTLGSVLSHVLLHQTVIGQEAIKQFEQIDDYPDIIFGCIGGGSSFSGAFYPFYYDKVSNHAPKDCEFVAVEPTACPSMTKGNYMYDHADVARMTPLFKMYTLGHTFIPPPIHAGGLRYHGKAPTLCLLHKEGKVGVKAYNQLEVFETAILFSRTEGVVPAPEPAHAIKAAVDEALRCKETGEEKTIFFPLCGHGYFDMQAYDDYHSGKLKAYEYPKEKVDEAMKELRDLYPWINDQ